MRFSVKASRVSRLLLTLIALAGCGGIAAAVPEPADVRVLIDISGSMRQNDPQNLRRPALRMLAGLLQPGTRAGVWTFARWVNNLVPVADVDAAWKRRIRSLSEQISSPGQFTNIGSVLEQAAGDWQGEATTHARHLILLTDGMVDVSTRDDENQAARADIIDRLLPRLQAAGVKIHTIALSERADHELMRRLAGETSGWYQQVAHADQLQRAFLRMFETVGTPDGVPLQDNRFVVDGSIKEATALVFSRADSPPVVLHSPSGVEYSDSDVPAGIVWHRDLGYDLITIASPQKGEWRLEAAVDPDNRVMIVTDLKLQTSEIPTHIAAGEQTRIEAHLTNRREMIARQDFLRLLDVSAVTTGAAGTLPLALNDRGEPGDEQPGDGRYGMLFGDFQAQAEVELLIAIDSPTFMREKRFRLKVHEPVEARVVEAPDGPVLTVGVQAAVMQPGASLTAWQQDFGGQRTELTLTPNGEGGWSAPLADLVAPVHVKLSGTTRLGMLLERTLGPLMPPGIVPPPVFETPVSVPTVDLADAVAAPAEDTGFPDPPEHAGATAGQGVTDTNLLTAAFVFGGFNLTLLLAGGAWWLLRRRRGSASAEPSLEQLIEPSAATRAAGDNPRKGNARPASTQEAA